MFEQLLGSAPVLCVASFPFERVVLVLLGALIAFLALLVVALCGYATIRIGWLSIEPPAAAAARAAEPEPSGPHSSPFNPEPTEPFNLAEMNAAMRDSETMRAVSALRAMETRLAGESKRSASVLQSPGVCSIVMRVAPLCVLYEVSGSTPRCHIIPSDVRVVRVGRATDSDIRCKQSNVSLHHFKLVISAEAEGDGALDQAVHVEDPASMNGTWVNGKRIEVDQRVRLTDGDVIEAASSRFIFYHVFRGEGR
ncbi:MAG: FHA domain-containing protein [Polyangiaceae bacterium]|jgi:hypothetical protein|nr:FHA domain-containing protein [Polyangiaceae bacterium]